MGVLAQGLCHEIVFIVVRVGRNKSGFFLRFLMWQNKGGDMHMWRNKCGLY